MGVTVPQVGQLENGVWGACWLTDSEIQGCQPSFLGA